MKPRGRRAESSRGASLRLVVAPEITERVRARLQATAHETALNMGETDGSAFWELFPRFKEAVDALPDLMPLVRCAQEMRWLPLDGYRAEGVPIPPDIYRSLNLPEPSR